ncbi:helix-turn-helix domain-containing protein [Novosphingobium subterraneum]|uniref:helix-turn-helix domain-containing protein n=1 Tax=Novosphingobium subterraneum TaxID=48936 RepID=UPI003D02EE59
MAEAGGLQDITNIDTTPMPPGQPGRQSVGEMLRAAREAAGLDIKQLSQATRVTTRHLQALEVGDYAAFPGRPYTLGFAKSYARAVGLDDKVIAEAVRAELDQQAPPPPPRVINQFEVGDPEKTPSRLTAWLAAGLVIAIALAGLVFWRSYYLPSAELPPLVGPEEARPVPSQVAAAPAPVASPAGPVVFTATEDRIWVKFYDGTGKQILQKELAKGESFTVPTDVPEPKLWTGRPDALAITVGGQPVPRIAEKEGIVKDVAVSAAALLARGTAAATTSPVPTPSAAAPVARPAPRPRAQRPVAASEPTAAPATTQAEASPPPAAQR